MPPYPMAFAREYIACVLNQNFEDARAQFFEPLMAIHGAHLIMLAECGIVSRDDARAIRDALASIDSAAIAGVRYDGSCEDLFSFVDRLIVDRCGDDVGGRLHTARSRNDIDMTMYRMQQRHMILGVLAGTLELRRVFLQHAAVHRDTLFPALTHTQPAQPSTLAHYYLAIVEQLERDTTRLRAAFASTNRSPLGACAITGTGFPIDRERTAELLGFDATTGNTYGSIATVDYLLESTSAVAVLLAGLGRVVQDLLLWCTAEVGYLRLPDGFVQRSSIMPQKRNPVALEHARALASKALGQSSAILLAVHNTPFGDIVDTEDDLQPLVYSMFKDAIRAVRLVSAALERATFDVQRMAGRAEQGWITVTELADTLVREHGVPFKTAHAIAAQFISASEAAPDRSKAAVLREVTSQVLQAPVEYSEIELAGILSPRHFVEVRTTSGGPAPSATGQAIEISEARLADDGKWLERSAARLEKSSTDRATALASL